MRRVIICLFLMFSLLILGLVASSAQAPWSLWVYQPDSGRLLRVDNTGQVIETQNIAIQANGAYPQNLIPSPDGTKIAYVHPSNQQISVMDLGTGTMAATIDLSEIGIAHNQDDRLYLSEVAFGLDSNYLVYKEILGGLAWQIHVYDIAANSIIESLTFADEVAVNYPALHGGVRPIISHISGDRITFTVDLDFPKSIHSYHWFYGANILSETVAAQTSNAIAFPYSHDIVNIVHDGRFPADHEDFRHDWDQINALHAYTANQGRFPFFYEADLSFQRLWFVQSGERLLAEAYVDEIVDVWVLIDREGNEIRRYPAAGDDAIGTPDGYVYTTTVENQTAIVNVDTRNSDNAGTTLWIQPEHWDIIWAGSNQPQNTFRDWLQLAQAAQDPTGIVDRYATPTQAPPVPPFRDVGMAIQIYVPEDGYLNLRDAPTTNSNIITLLESGTRGIIISGPVDAEGFIWWEISTTGRTGWVVEELPDSLALIPPQLIASVTPTPTQTESP